MRAWNFNGKKIRHIVRHLENSWYCVSSWPLFEGHLSQGLSIKQRADSEVRGHSNTLQRFFNRSELLIIHEYSKTDEGRLNRCLLRCCLPGEYLSIILMFHASMGSLVWAITAVKSPANLFVTVAGLWIAARVVGVFAQRRFTPLVTAALLITLVLTQQYGQISQHSAMALFSVSLFVVMIVLVFLLDIAELIAANLDSDPG